MTMRERCLRAMEYHEKGLNCGQSVLLAFADITGFSEEQSMALASGFGGGLRCGGVCGVVNAAAVVLGMVYNYLPFAITPLHSIMVKIDKSVIEAAQDLGANGFRVFTRVLLPLSIPGIITAITMVFVPSVSTFIISRMLGGGQNILIGDLIEQQFLGSVYNPYVGSAMSLILMVIILLIMSVINHFDDDEMEGMIV